MQFARGLQELSTPDATLVLPVAAADMAELGDAYATLPTRSLPPDTALRTLATRVTVFPIEGTRNAAAACRITAS
jgi:hypothetical protein